MSAASSAASAAFVPYSVPPSKRFVIDELLESGHKIPANLTHYSPSQLAAREATLNSVLTLPKPLKDGEKDKGKRIVGWIEEVNQNDTPDEQTIYIARHEALNSLVDAVPEDEQEAWRLDFVRASRLPHPVLRITEDTSLSVSQRASRIRTLSRTNQRLEREQLKDYGHAQTAAAKKLAKRANRAARYAGVARGSGRTSPHQAAAAASSSLLSPEPVDPLSIARHIRARSPETVKKEQKEKRDAAKKKKEEEDDEEDE